MEMKNSKNDSRGIQVHNAVKDGDISRVSELIEEGCGLNFVVNGKTPLAEAAYNGDKKIIDLLLASGADVNSNEALSPLCAAAAANKPDTLRYLFLRGCTLNLRRCKHRNAHATPLQIAIENDNTEIARILLQNGHDPNFSSKHCDIPLVEAIKYNRPAIVKLLLDTSHCQVEVQRNIFGRLKPSPLHEALFTYQSYEIAEILLKSKRVRLDFDGHSFISWMLCRIFDTTYRAKKIICLLLEAGGDMVYLDKNGNRPVTTVVYGNSRIFKLRHARPILEIIIEAGIPATIDDVQPLYDYVESEDDQNFCDWLTEVACNPRTLREQCRTLIRKYFGKFPNDKIKLLGLPTRLEKYVTLEVYRDWRSSKMV